MINICRHKGKTGSSTTVIREKLGVIFSWSADNERMLREVGSWGEWLLAYWQSWSLWWCVYNSRERPPLLGQSESGHQGVNTWRVTLREFNRALRWFMTNNKWHWIMHVIPGGNFDNHRNDLLHKNIANLMGWDQRFNGSGLAKLNISKRHLIDWYFSKNLNSTTCRTLFHS